MKELEVTWNRATRIWWSFTWRFVLFGVMAAAITGFLVDIFLDALAKQEESEYFVQLAKMIVLIPVDIWIVKTVLMKRFRHYRIVLIPHPFQSTSRKTVSEDNA